MRSAPAQPSFDVAAWDVSGPPRSRRHGDIYFSADDGLGEARAVFLEGCGLPAAWAGRRHFCIGELGLGAGLNLAATLDLWRRTGPAKGRLHLFSVENEPLSPAEVARALAPWPEIADIAGLLVSRWPVRARGFHRLDLPEVSATLDIAVFEAREALERWDGRADAWFLDGFSPALDPPLWREEVMALVAARSAPDARTASYTVAGAVRRSLEASGFVVERRPGHGRKRERLEARLTGEPLGQGPRPKLAIIGAGIAGVSLARALEALGVQTVLFDAQRPGAGASGGPCALAAPRLDAGLGPIAELFAQAARRAVQLYDQVPGTVTSRGAVQLATRPKDGERFAAIAASDLFERGAMTLLNPDQAGDLLGEAASQALFFETAVTVDPARLLAAWGAGVRRARIARLERTARGWCLISPDDQVVADADLVCVAAGAASAQLCPGLPLSVVRGQATVAQGASVGRAVGFGGYALPGPGGVMFGSTHDRGDLGIDLRPEDDRRNLASVIDALPRLAERLGASPFTSWAATRATTADYLPLAGLWSEGLFVLSGLGSRGFCLAPLLAEHIAALMVGEASPLPQPLSALVDPARFARRAAQRGRAAFTPEGKSAIR